MEEIRESNIKYFWLILILFIILFIFPTSHAGLYKCYDQNGSVQYTDEPCEGNSSTLNLEPLNINSDSKSSSTNVNSEDVKMTKRVDKLICKGGVGTKLPAKLCLGSQESCKFPTAYLKRVVTNLDKLKSSISEKQVELLKKYSGTKTEVWEFGTPSSEWDSGTGMRGYVVIKKGKGIFFVPTLYQGFPNIPPAGHARMLPAVGKNYKQCTDRSIMDRN